MFWNDHVKVPTLIQQKCFSSSCEETSPTSQSSSKPTCSRGSHTSAAYRYVILHHSILFMYHVYKWVLQEWCDVLGHVHGDIQTILKVSSTTELYVEGRSYCEQLVMSQGFKNAPPHTHTHICNVLKQTGGGFYRLCLRPSASLNSSKYKNISEPSTQDFLSVSLLYPESTHSTCMLYIEGGNKGTQQKHIWMKEEHVKLLIDRDLSSGKNQGC